MFPIVPQNFEFRNHSFSSPELITSFVTGSSKLLVPGKVTASGAIPQGAVSAPIEAAQLVGQSDVVQISAQPNSLGIIDLEKNSKEIWSEKIHWVRALRLSDDCHSYNIQLRFQPNQRPGTSFSKNVPTSKLILQAVRPIETGQELLLWFSEDILAMLQIAFLTPSNIQGQKKYVCTKCSALYESPNPLKLHISLGCGRYTITSLWERLSNAIRENTLQNVVKQDIFDFKLSPEPQIMRQRNAMDLSMSNSSQNKQETSQKDIYRPYNSETSAFRPFRKFQDEGFTHSENLLVPIMENVQIWPLAPFEQNNFLQHTSNEDEAHIETLVSSLGKSKQGHICLYCGKCYSRKYGLKIHIRTHTGYKPLKCKFCMRPFGDPSNLNKHVRLHAEGNTPYKCDLCGKILVRRRDLDRHLKSRHMIEMHPGLNILQEDSNPDEDVKGESEIPNS
ncbi:zinc finger protein 560 [Tribolium madens]|uniref:zinc finger protein 560 n=1 Tax=Tribolium madens TaxID=41895 RepID=UPI001CF75F93|nr:zinc finger protein 560 [Tribolium madens]